MSVTVDYLAVCSHNRNLTPILAELLRDAIKQIYNKESVFDEPPEAEELSQYITIRYTKNRDYDHQICGFSVDFDIASVDFEVASQEMGDLIHEFSKSVAKNTGEGINHLLKLNDPQLQHTLRTYAEAIFEIEMKLREVLSLIFVDTYGIDFYDLLKETQITPSSQPKPKQMRKYYENQFFFLLFSHYKHINDLKPPDPDTVLEYIQQVEDFGELKKLITATPITEGQYADFLESLKDAVGPIEKLRNCVAHNRSIPEEIIEDYEMAKEPLLESISGFLEELANCEVIYETETRN